MMTLTVRILVLCLTVSRWNCSGFVLSDGTENDLENEEELNTLPNLSQIEGPALQHDNSERVKRSPEFEDGPNTLPNPSQIEGPAQQHDNSERVKRSSEFEVGPNNQKCIWKSASSGNRFYDHVDENGQSCICELCGPGYILKENCNCSTESDMPQPSVCALVDQGKQMMPDTNKCTTGYDCKVCEHPWTVVSPCGPTGPDTECGCVEDYYLAHPDDCQEYPRCDRGHEPVSGHGEHYSEIRCQPCREGYFQPKDNTTDKCKRHRQCMVRQGTSYYDNVCLNDPELPTAPEGAVPTDASSTGEIGDKGEAPSTELSPNDNEAVSAEPAGTENTTVTEPPSGTTASNATEPDKCSCPDPWPKWLLALLIGLPWAIIFAIIIVYLKKSGYLHLPHFCKGSSRCITSKPTDLEADVPIDEDQNVSRTRIPMLHFDRENTNATSSSSAQEDKRLKSKGAKRGKARKRGGKQSSR